MNKKSGATFISLNKMQANKPNKKKKMLITGVSGLLGNNLAYYFRKKFNILGLYLTHPFVIEGIQIQIADLLSERSFKSIVHNFNPDILIHCASLTNVDFCETNHELTDRVNIMGTRVVVESVKETHTKLVYISSDSVYDGGKGDFQEADPVNPQNYYGLSKYKGELEVFKKSGTLIMRTNFFGWNIQEKYSIAEWILNELSNKKQIKGFRDAFFTSIYTFDLAKILDIAIQQDLTGLFNCGSSTSLSKYEFALHIADCFNLDKDLIQPSSIADFDFRAKRGKNLTLNVSKLEKILEQKLPTITESIEAFYRDFESGLPAKIKG
jgi:dTDP-4-dehydrorhamnose reductase